VYSIGSLDASLPIAQAIEYLSSTTITTAGALETSGSQVLLGWKDASTYGIDKLSTNKETGVIETPIALGKFNKVRVYYSELPSSTSITCKLSQDGGAFVSHTLVQDTTRMLYESQTVIGNKATLQIQVSLVPNAADAPSIYDIELV